LLGPLRGRQRGIFSRPTLEKRVATHQGKM
jgi:hypothetical protein